MSFSAKVKELDKNRCIHCGRDGRYFGVEAHHIIYRSKSKELINDPDNGITLCSICHQLIHAHRLSMLDILNKVKFTNKFRWKKVYYMLTNGLSEI